MLILTLQTKKEKRAFGQRAKQARRSVGDRAALHINRFDTSANSQCLKLAVCMCLKLAVQMLQI